MARELKTKAPAGRPRRTPITKRNRLTIKDRDPNYQYRIVNIIDDRVEQLLEQGYEIDPQPQVGDVTVDTASPLGSAKQISVGQGTKAVVMRIPKEYFEEDQAFKQEQIDALESAKRDEAKSYVGSRGQTGKFDYDQN